LRAKEVIEKSRRRLFQYSDNKKITSSLSLLYLAQTCYLKSPVQKKAAKNPNHTFFSGSPVFCLLILFIRF